MLRVLFNFAGNIVALYIMMLPAWAANLRTLAALAVHPAMGAATCLALFLIGSGFSNYFLVHLILFIAMWTAIFMYHFITWCYWIGKV